MILKLKSHSNREETYTARGPSRVHYIEEKERDKERKSIGDVAQRDVQVAKY